MPNDLHLLKTQNRLINLIRCNPSISKSNLSDALGLSWPTISSNVDALAKENILDISEGLKVNPSFGHMIGLSIGTAQIKLSIISGIFTSIAEEQFKSVIEKLDIFKEARSYMMEKEKEIKNYIFFRTPDNLFELQLKIDSIMADIEKIVNNQEELGLNIISIGIAFTGAVDNKNKKIVKSHNLPFLSDRPLNDIIYPNRLDFFDEKNINIYMDNNSNAAVVAEKYNMYLPESNTYKYRNKKDIIAIYLGAGTGAGLIFDNKYYCGTTSFAGEIGHLDLPSFQGRSFRKVEDCCSCGSCSCLDFRIRNDVFEMTKEEFSELDSDSIANFLLANPDKLEMFCFYYGKIVNLLINIMNPDLILFTGKFKSIADFMWSLLIKEKNANNLSYIANDCEFKASKLGATSPSIGIGCCAYFDKIKEKIAW